MEDLNMRNVGKIIEIFSYVFFGLAVTASAILAFALGIQTHSTYYYGTETAFYPEIFFSILLGGPLSAFIIMLIGVGFGKIVSFAEKGLYYGLTLNDFSYHMRYSRNDNSQNWTPGMQPQFISNQPKTYTPPQSTAGVNQTLSEIEGGSRAVTETDKELIKNALKYPFDEGMALYIKENISQMSEKLQPKMEALLVLPGNYPRQTLKEIVGE